MNVQDLLHQIILLVPQFQQSAGAIVRLLPAFFQSVGVFASSVQGFIAAQGGWQAILQRISQSGIGRAMGAVAQSGVGQFVGAAAGAAAGAIGGSATATLATVTAALASPLGQVALAAAGVAAAFVGLGVAAQAAMRAFLESQRHLAEISPSMALVFAQSDFRRMSREMRAGESQASTAGFLARGLDDLADTLQPILSLLTNIANVIGGIVTRIIDVLVTPISWIAELISSFFKWIKDHWPWGGDDADGEPIALSQWLDDVMADAQRRRRPAMNR